MTERKITPGEMLDCREKRAAQQKDLLLHFGTPIISLTLVWPGEIKDTDMSRYVMVQAIHILEETLSKQNKLFSRKGLQFSATGPEAMYCVAMDTPVLKQLCVTLEESHPLGRLWDIDVIGEDGRPVSRSDIVVSRRRCLLCNEFAHLCARSQSHDLGDLLKVIHRRIDDFKQAAQV